MGSKVSPKFWFVVIYSTLQIHVDTIEINPSGIGIKIPGGEDAENVPYQISLQFNGEHYCGGTIVDPSTILSSALCLHYFIRHPEDLYKLKIVAGEFDFEDEIGREQRRDADRVILHPEYGKPTPLVHNIAVVKLKRPLRVSLYVTSIEMYTTDPIPAEGGLNFFPIHNICN